MKEFNNINEILDFAIDSEQKAIDFYTQLSEKVKSEAMKNVFIQFAGEEMGHKAKLIEIKAKGFFDKEPERTIDLKISDYTVSASVHPDLSYQEALVIAMNREKAAFKLYSNLANRAPNETLRNLFLSLAQEESKHKLRFEIEYDEYVLREN